MDFSCLLSPVRLGKNLELKNRFVVPAMETNYADREGYITQRMIDYYTARAKGGFGLIIMEMAAVDPLGKAVLCEAGLWEDGQIEGFKRLADSVHGAGGKIFAQLHHGGRQTTPEYLGGQQPVAPSAVPCPVMGGMPRPLKIGEIWELIGKFGDAARRAKQAGFDGVEIHGAHGYLVAQFMSPHANKRADEFGGDFMGRMKFPLEIFKEVRRKTGPDFPLCFRFSYDEKVAGGRTLEESTMIARLAQEAGVDALNVSITTYGSMPYMSAPAAMPPGFNQYATQTIKQCVSIPVMAVGRCNAYVAEDILKNGRADLICFGRESLADPELPNKVREGRLEEVCPCIYCVQSCLGYLFDPQRGKISCLANPVVGHEGEYDFSPAPQKKKVMVVGGGPAGLMAAWVAAKRGHAVSLYEKEEELGGQFRLAAVPPAKQDIMTLLKYYAYLGKKYGVKVFTRTEVEPELVRREAPDAVVLATGGAPIRPKDFPGMDGERVVTASDVLSGKAVAGGKVLVVGGGMTGAETADFLGEQNRDVTLVEMQPQIATDVEPGPRYFLLRRLREHRVNIFTSTKITALTPDGASCVCEGVSLTMEGFDTIVLAMGVKSYNPLEPVLENSLASMGMPALYVIGDAKTAGKANAAIEDGLAVGLLL